MPALAFPGGRSTTGVDIEVFTTRPDTLFGATYMVLAARASRSSTQITPEWPVAGRRRRLRLVQRVRSTWKGRVLRPEQFQAEAGGLAIASSRRAKSDLERQAEGREKTGVFTGAFAVNPTNSARIPIFIADYVLMGYGTGAIMAVPAHDHRDFEFAREFELAIVPVVRPSDEWLAEHGASVDDTSTWPEAYVGDGVGMSVRQ